MSPSPKVWKNLPDQSTPITAEELNRLEEQAYSLDFPYIDLFDDESDFGKIYYDSTADTLNFVHKNAIQQIGEEIYIQITNNTGAIIQEGALVAFSVAGVQLFNANGSIPPSYFLGMATHEIPIGARGRLTQFGRVNGLDTSGYTDRAILYADPAVLGGVTTVKPTAPNTVLTIGAVTSVSTTNGQIFVRPILENQRFFGTFYKTDSATLAVINTATPITLNFAGLANGVEIDQLNPTRIKVNQSGLYHFGVSFQLASTNSSVKDVRLWFKKNGSDLPNTTIVGSLESGTAKYVQSRTMNVSMSKDDYIELYWGSPDTGVSLSAIASNAWSPAAPSVILNVNQVQQ
jgi:hypothetical protein